MSCPQRKLMRKAERDRRRAAIARRRWRRLREVLCCVDQEPKISCSQEQKAMMEKCSRCGRDFWLYGMCTPDADFEPEGLRVHGQPVCFECFGPGVGEN